MTTPVACANGSRTHTHEDYPPIDFSPVTHRRLTDDSLLLCPRHQPCWRERSIDDDKRRLRMKYEKTYIPEMSRESKTENPLVKRNNRNALLGNLTKKKEMQFPAVPQLRVCSRLLMAVSMANETSGISISFNPSCCHFLRCQFPIRLASMTHSSRMANYVFNRFLVFLIFEFILGGFSFLFSFFLNALTFFLCEKKKRC